MLSTFNKKGLIILFVAALPVVPLATGKDASPVDFDPFGSSEISRLSIPKAVTATGPVIPQIQFNNNEISMAFQIISDATGWSIFPTAEVSKAKVSLWAKNIGANELLDTVVTLAGFIYHREGDIISVMTYDEYVQYYGLAKKVMPLTYADASSVANVIKPFLTKLGKNVVHKETNTIVLYEAQANLESIAGIIEKLDVPAENIVVEVINLKYADCESLARILQGVFVNRKNSARNKNPEDANAPAADQAKDGKATQPDGPKDVLVPYEQVGIYAVSHANQLVVVGTKSDIQKIKDIVAKVDVYGENTVLEVIDLAYADAEILAETLQKVFSSKESKDNLKNVQKVEKSPEHSGPQIVASEAESTGALLTPRAYVEVYSVGRTNQLIIKALRGDIEKLRKLVEKLDSYVEPTTKSYHFTYVDASEIYTGLERILDVSGRYGSYSSPEGQSRQQGSIRGGITLIEKNNSVLVTGPPSVHRIMASIIESIDVPATYEAGIIRVYKLENADVDEVASAIRELLQSQDKQKPKSGEVKFSEEPPSGNPKLQNSGDLTKTEEFIPQIVARVAVSKATNSVIVQATARQHRELEKLIKELDKRRKQVLIEAMIVEVVTTDSLDLGVELNHANGSVLAFSSFGLSKIDPVTGVRDIIVGPGGTAAVLEPDGVQAILQALQSTENAKITSAPQILVNDNAVGFINSVAEEPYTQINASQTVATTSFGGFVQAGTQFAITPHISENDYLRVEYEITLNSFGKKASDNSIPPPRSTTSIKSEATVPDQCTIVVGGLQNADESKTVDKIPLLGDIPLIGYAFRNTSISKAYKTTYLFITPSIIKRDDFSDLKQVSDKLRQEVKNNAKHQTSPNSETKATD